MASAVAWLALALLLALLPWLPAVAADAPSFDADVGLDPGHSVADVGASGGGLREYELTLDVALRTRALLEARGYSVRLTRVDAAPLTAMTHPDLTERTRIEQEARIAAAGRVRCYISLHFNGSADPRLAGTETYVNPDNQGDASWRLGEALQRHVVAALREGGYPTLDRGVKSDLLAGKPYGHFFSLRGPFPSALVEALFLSNPADAAALAHEGIREALARGYSGGISEYLEGETSGER